MFDEVNKRFDIILDIFEKNKQSTDLINKAYRFADEKHKGALRKDGKPYISHPVEVARTLAKLGFNEDVVSAALLHDVVEDCGVTLDDITCEFNENVASLVDCVSAIDREKYVLDHENLYEDANFMKASLEEQSFKKLITIGKQNPEGFCIKFADRLHNLRTIDCFDYNKQLEKVKETEKWIIPIAKRLSANYFYKRIKNECFKIVNKKDIGYFLEQYSIYHKSNEKNFQNALGLLNDALLDNNIVAIKYEEIKEYKIYEDISNISKNIKISKISQGQILKVANYNIYIIYNGIKFDDAINDIISNMNKKLSHSFTIIDMGVDSITEKTFFMVEDEFKNKYNFYVLTIEEYSQNQIGVMSKKFGDILDDDEIDDMVGDLIKVKTRSGEIKYIQKGSTVLDFAFKIHKDIGFGFNGAIINGSKTKIPPYTKLIENDQVEILVEKDNDGKIINQARLRWFAYVNTDFAKKCLIKYFEQKSI